jgi:hypothetical protein
MLVVQTCARRNRPGVFRRRIVGEPGNLTSRNAMAAQVEKRTSPVRRRPWLRFGMRSLLALVALCAVACEFWSEALAYRAEQSALAELRPPGGFLTVEGEWFDLR